MFGGNRIVPRKDLPKRMMMLMVLSITLGLWMALGVTCGPLPSAVWPPPLSASCTGAAGSAFSPSLSFTFSGLGAASAIARNASQRYLPILVEGSVEGARGPAVGEITSVAVRYLSPFTCFYYL